MLNRLGRIHLVLSPYKRILFGVSVLVVIISSVWLSQVVVREDIWTMLPEHGAIAEDFQLLRQAPFAQRLTITVTQSGGCPTAAAFKLATALREQPEFTHVVTGPSGQMDAGFLARLTDLAPPLFDAADLHTLTARLDRDHIRSTLEQNRMLLISPGGLALKDAINRDPLGLRNQVLSKLTPLARFAKVRVENGMFVSQDGQHALILADTDIPLTDAQGADRLIAAFDRAASVLPDGAQGMLLSGHRHTQANANAIKADLQLILPASFLALMVIFLFFLRSVQSILAFLVPVSVMSIAGIGTAAIYGDMSGIVLGFGGVLLGVAVDYALYIFLALRAGDEYAGRSVAEVLQDVARPVTYGALTSLAGFAALLASDIPGIRQLAVFSMIGLSASLALSLFVLPHGITPSQCPARTACTVHNHPGSPRLGFLLIIWAVILVCGAWAGMHLRMNGDLRALSYVPTRLTEDETTTRNIWGSMREMAMIFASGTDIDQALNTNDAVWDLLGTRGLQQDAMSIAPFWPGSGRQQANIAAWKQFVDKHGTAVQQILADEKRLLGYSAVAFTPFADFLQHVPAPITSATIDALGLKDMTSMLIVSATGQHLIMTLLPDTPELDRLGADYEQRGLNARLVSGSRFRELLGHAMMLDATRFSLIALAAVAGLTYLMFRDLPRTLIALLPAGTGIIALMMAMALTDQSINLFHIVSFPLIMGLSSDYGIFMTNYGERIRRSTTRSVLLAGLTTLAGFGILILARHPALHSIGLTVLTGISTAMVTARWGIPLLWRVAR